MKKRRVNISKPPKLVDALGTLGSILKEEELANRDAVHIAVLPVTARHDLSPGNHVSIDEDMKAYVDDSEDKRIGIVDPFLPRTVLTGEHFYLFLYPRTITALQHHWQHPDVPDVGVLAEGARHVENVEGAVAYLREYCGGYDHYDTPSYGALIRGAVDSLGYGEEYITIGGEDANGAIPEQVINALRLVLAAEGHTVPASWSPNHYSCSC